MVGDMSAVAISLCRDAACPMKSACLISFCDLSVLFVPDANGSVTAPANCRSTRAHLKHITKPVTGYSYFKQSEKPETALRQFLCPTSKNPLRFCIVCIEKQKNNS